MTGGFVGYTSGITEYSTLGVAAKALVNFLEKVLDSIPGIGLDAIVKVLFENALPLDTIAPKRYINPVITSCTVSGLTGTVGQAGTDYNGGFAGQQIGTQMIDCHVAAGDYTVYAENYGGGFVGLARDGEIQGMLQAGLNVADLYNIGQPQSLLLQCGVEGWTPTTTDEQPHAVYGSSYLGGFAGGLANSYTLTVVLKCRRERAFCQRYRKQYRRLGRCGFCWLGC